MATDKSDNEPPSKSPYAVGIFFLFITTFFFTVDYFDLTGRYKGEDLVILAITASDPPTYVETGGGEVKSERYYSLKAQEYNCHFLIRGVGLDMVRDEEGLRSRVEAITRGDSLHLAIPASEEKNINSLYFKGSIIGLTVGNKQILSANDVQSQGGIGRKIRLWIFGTIWLAIFTGIVIKLLTQSVR